MTTTQIPSTTTRVVRAGRLGALGGALTALSGLVVTGVVRPTTTVTPDRWSYPWTPGAFVAVSLLYAVFHVLVAIGVIGFVRSRVGGPGRAAVIGGWIAAGGTLALGVAELVSIPIAGRGLEDPAAGLVGAVFGVGNLVAAIGLLVAGVATVRAGVWDGWRRWTPLATGLILAAVLPLAPTPWLAAGVGVYGLAVMVFGIALSTQPAPAPGPRPATVEI